MQATKKTHVRYLILLMLFLVTTINYADRATIAIAGSSLQKDLGIDAVTLGYIFSAFGWAYVAGQIPGGWLLDRFGSKNVYAFSIFSWSLFTMLQGFVGGMPVAWSVVTLFTLRSPCAFWSVSPKPRRSRATPVSSRPGSRRQSVAPPRRSSTRRNTSPRRCSPRSWAGSSTPSAGSTCSS